jgi:hypothetical protein
VRSDTSLNKLATAAVVAILALGATGCTNSGAATTCGEYNKMTADQKVALVKKVLADKGNSNPTNAEVNVKVLLVDAYCQTAGRDSDPISKSGI